MVYIGNSSASNFASVTKDTFSGNASTTAFTLSKTATTNGVAVFVENVRQIPTTAYSVSGTTLTFTAAPPSGTNNIYVLHHNAPASTATHPAAQDLTAANATLTGDVTIGSGTAADRKILFDGNAQDYHIGLDDSSDSLIIGKGSALGTTSHIVTDANGIVTMPLQPALIAHSNANNTQSFSSADSYEIVQFNVETIDKNSDYASSQTFTAPVDGTYYANANIMRAATSSGSITYDLAIYVNSSLTLYSRNHGDNSSSNTITQNVTGLVDLDASDTLQVYARVSDTKGTRYASQTTTYFHVFLVA